MFEGAVGRFCQFVADHIGDAATIVLLALSFGLAFLLSGLTVAQTTTYLLRRAVRQAVAYVIHTGKKYFQHLKWMGLTQRSCQIAVVCSVAAWLGLLMAFAFKPYWLSIVAFTLVLVTILSVEGWQRSGKRKKVFKFVRSFYEPTFALTVPAFAGKIVDAGLRVVAGA